MNKKIYIREGRRFKQLQNHVGEYYNSNCKFTKERTKSSLGICVLQEGTTCTIAEFRVAKNISWDEAMKTAERIGRHLPTQKEVLALTGHEEFKHDHFEWLQTEFNSERAWLWYWRGSNYSLASFNDYGKCNDGAYFYARYFFNIET